jgi:putative peptidoglycan lipid II flippase
VVTGKARPQTAIQGVAFASLLNTLAKATVYLRHVIITMYIGLTVELDAFYVAASVVSLFINVFGDIYDSVGIPFLVRAREKNGFDSFRSLTGSLFSLTLATTAMLTLLMLLASPFAHLIVPGFQVTSREFIRNNLYFLLPYALAYLPYHCLGSFFRATRNFKIFYWSEFLVQGIALAGLLAYHRHELAVPGTLSAGYLGGFAFLLWYGRKEFRFRGSLSGEETGEVGRQTFKLLPLYMIGYGLILVDRYFASYLEAGGISALTYGFIVASVVPMILNIENIFITPLSEESDRGILLTYIVSGILLVSVPVIVFTETYGYEIIQVFFQRGAFTPHSTELTGTALKYYILGLPGLFFWPVCIRVFQVSRKIRKIVLIGLVSLALNATLNYLFVFWAGMGVAGIALATSLSGWTVSILGVSALPRLGVRLAFKLPGTLMGNIAIATVVALLVSISIPVPTWKLGELILKGMGFVAVYIACLFLIPNRHLREIIGMVRYSFPLGFRQ